MRWKPRWYFGTGGAFSFIDILTILAHDNAYLRKYIEMSERYPYPENEHYVFPKTRAEIINDELSFYPDPEELRHMSVGLAKLYSETPIMSTMRKYAFLMNVVHIASDGRGDDSKVDSDFLMGSLYGVHTSTHTASPTLRRRILDFDPLKEITGEDDSDLECRKELMQYLNAWEKHGFEEKYNEAPEELQVALSDLAKHMYGCIHEPQRKERSFMTGYMFVTSIIDHNIDPRNIGAPA